MAGDTAEDGPVNVRSKLAKLERETAKLACAVCRGVPRMIVLEKEGDSIPEKRPCASCGNTSTLIIYTGVPRNPNDA